MSVQSVLFVHLAFLYGPSPHALGSLCGAGSPCTHPQALRESMAKPCSAPRVTFVSRRKSPKACQGACPLNPRGGIIIPPAASPLPPERAATPGSTQKLNLTAAPRINS